MGHTNDSNFSEIDREYLPRMVSDAFRLHSNAIPVRATGRVKDGWQVSFCSGGSRSDRCRFVVGAGTDDGASTQRFVVPLWVELLGVWLLPIDLRKGVHRCTQWFVMPLKYLICRSGLLRHQWQYRLRASERGIVVSVWDELCRRWLLSGAMNVDRKLC